MRILILGGAGIIGRAVAKDLSTDVDEVVIADLDFEGAKVLAGTMNGGIQAVHVDVRDAGSLEKALRGADACINCVNYYFNLEVMLGCLATSVPYLDLGGLFHTTRKQLELHDRFKENNLTAVLGMGSCPGVANAQAGLLAKDLDRVDYVRIYNGSTLDEGESLSWAYSLETILDEISLPAMVYRDGQFIERQPLSEEEYYLFPDPIGYAKTHLSLHSEVATLPLSLADKGIQECFFKITFFGYSEAVLRKLQFLTELGLASTAPISVSGVQVRPRDVLLALLQKAPAAKQPPESKGFKDIATEIQGSRNGERIKLRMDTWAWPHETWEMSGSKLMVASPPAVAARWLASGDLHRPGVWPPEIVFTGPELFAALAGRGIETSLTQETPIAMKR